MVRLKNRNFLIVDDEPEIREIVKDIIEGHDAIVEVAGNGQEAVELVKIKKYDVIISDIKMPRGDGLYLLEEIKKIRQPIPAFFFISGFAIFNEDELIAKGARSLFSKPFDFNQVLSVISSNL